MPKTKKTAIQKINKKTKNRIDENPRKITGFGYLMNTLSKYSPFGDFGNYAEFIKDFFTNCLNKDTINPIIDNPSSRTEDSAYEKYMGKNPNPINPTYARILYNDLSTNNCKNIIKIINKLPKLKKEHLFDDLSDFYNMNTFSIETVGEFFSEILLFVLKCKLDKIDYLDEIKTLYYKKKIKDKIGNKTIAPEITGDNILVIDTNTLSVENNDSLKTYLNKMESSYNKISSIVYNNATVPFYDLYVCNNIKYPIERIENNERKIDYDFFENITMTELLNYIQKRIILSGTGGLGKTMMIKHLILDTLKNFNKLQMLPISINLRDYRHEHRGIENLIKDSIERYSKKFFIENYKIFLNLGKIVFLFDGLDEIPLDECDDFIYDFKQFTAINSNNFFIVSSRDMDNFKSINDEFKIFHLCPLTEDQSIELINKINYKPEQPEIKSKFITIIKQHYKGIQMDFVENPLLLSIMLLTYGQFGEIPDQLYKFYELAFNVLSRQHDAEKGLSREYKSKLNILNIEEIFSEFCARTYIDEIFKFNTKSFNNYMEQLKYIKVHNCDIFNLYYDLSTGLCLLFEDGNDILFTHRSFQEYFAALYFSKQSDVILQKLPEHFDKNKRSSRILTDKFFSMLYNMNPTKISHAIFYPFLVDRQSIWHKLNPQNEYFGFLQDCYKTLYYGDYECISNSSTKYHLLDFIINIQNIKKRDYFDDLPEENDFFEDEYYRIKSKPYDSNEYGFDAEETDIEAESFIPDDYPKELYPPESVGKQYTFNVGDLYNDREFYNDIYDTLNDDKYVLKKQYIALIEYINKLKAEIDNENNTDSLFPN